MKTLDLPKKLITDEYSDLETFLLLAERPTEYFEENDRKFLKRISSILASPFPKKRQKKLKKFIKKHPDEINELLRDPLALFFDIDEKPIKILQKGEQ